MKGWVGLVVVVTEAECEQSVVRKQQPNQQSNQDISHNYNTLHTSLHKDSQLPQWLRPW